MKLISVDDLPLPGSGYCCQNPFSLNGLRPRYGSVTMPCGMGNVLCPSLAIAVANVRPIWLSGDGLVG